MTAATAPQPTGYRVESPLPPRPCGTLVSRAAQHDHDRRTYEGWRRQQAQHAALGADEASS